MSTQIKEHRQFYREKERGESGGGGNGRKEVEGWSKQRTIRGRREKGESEEQVFSLIQPFSGSVLHASTTDTQPLSPLVTVHGSSPLPLLAFGQ